MERFKGPKNSLKIILQKSQGNEVQILNKILCLLALIFFPVKGYVQQIDLSYCRVPYPDRVMASSPCSDLDVFCRRVDSLSSSSKESKTAKD